MRARGPLRGELQDFRTERGHHAAVFGGDSVFVELVQVVAEGVERLLVLGDRLAVTDADAEQEASGG